MEKNKKMEGYFQFTLKVLKKGYQKLFGTLDTREHFYVEQDPNKVSDMIYQLLMSNEPCMIARFGAFELSTIINYLGIINPHHSAWKYIKGEQPLWWWNEKLMYHMQNNAGFFPVNEENLSRFSKLMVEDTKELNILGSWKRDEDYLLKSNDQIKKVRFLCLEPYWSTNPWSRALEGKRVLVVHPFAEDIISQYNNHREQLFEDNRVLPQFASLRVVKAVQSIGGESNGFKDWFEALDWMKAEMDKQPYDVVLIGCGAYGFPLAAHAKRTGHKAIHLGGVLQLLFGIKGKRWDTNYNKDFNYTSLFNRFWISPSESSKPRKAKEVEDACYW